MDAETTTSRTGSADAGPSDSLVLEVRTSKLGRSHGKAWKSDKGATRRTTMPASLKTPFEKRMERATARKAVLAVEQDMKDEEKAEKDAKVTKIRERRARAEEKARLETMAASMSAKKLQRMRKRQGRSKKING